MPAPIPNYLKELLRKMGIDPEKLPEFVAEKIAGTGLGQAQAESIVPIRARMILLTARFLCGRALEGPAVWMKVADLLRRLVPLGTDEIADDIPMVGFAVVQLGLPFRLVPHPETPAALAAAAAAAAAAPPRCTLRAVYEAWYGLNEAQRNAVLDYARSRAENWRCLNLQQIGAAGGASVAINIAALANVAFAVNAARRGEAQRFSGITPDTLPALTTLITMYPPGSQFPGFTRWGPGDHGTPDSNLRWHFMKHVCMTVKAGVEIDDPDEPAFWWNALAMQLNWEKLVECTPRGEETAPFQRFFRGGMLDLGQVRPFLETAILERFPRLLGHLMQTYLNSYRDYALLHSGRMNPVLVQSNGTLTFISGCSVNVFIIGRLDAGVLGISACYFASDIRAKMAGAISNKIWDLR